jgi:hypothetical protein
MVLSKPRSLAVCILQLDRQDAVMSATKTPRISMPPSAAMTTRRQIMTGALTGAAALSLASLAHAAPPRSETRMPSVTSLPTGDVRDFEFLVGTWEGHNRRLKKRWIGSNDWDVFTGRLRCESRLGGVVNVDEVDFPTKGWSGLTVRAFDIEQRRWAIYWINSRTGKLFPPVLGGFTGDRGEFYGDDMDEGRPVKVRFVWTRRGSDLALWEQAFSLDGKQWETNWTAEQRRVRS